MHFTELAKLIGTTPLPSLERNWNLATSSALGIGFVRKVSLKEKEPALPAGHHSDTDTDL